MGGIGSGKRITGNIVKKYLSKYPDMPNTQLARKIYKDNPTLFNNEEHPRSLIRYYTNSLGDIHRNALKDERFISQSKNKGEESPEYLEAQKKKLNKKSKIFIITWAQNDTPVHKQFLENIKKYAKFRKAEIHIILGRYKNPTSVFSDKPYDVWADEVLPYKDANRHKLHNNLYLLSDVKIQPTATNPLSAMEGFEGLNSIIVGSPKVHFKPVPAFEGYKPKMMMSTGAVTMKNYTDSKSGKKGEFHHTFGFVIVEIKNDKVFFPRQVTATSSGDFVDVIYNVTKDGIYLVDGVDAAILGDMHIGVTCPKTHAEQRGASGT